MKFWIYENLYYFRKIEILEKLITIAYGSLNNCVTLKLGFFEYLPPSVTQIVAQNNILNNKRNASSYTHRVMIRYVIID